MNWKFFLTIASRVLSRILDVLTPEIRHAIDDAVQRLYRKALKTDNPTDDMFVEVLAQLLGVELDEG